jgi:hypothetical protein
MITKFDKANLKNIREDISAILSSYAKENGIEIKIGNISFNEGSFTTKMEAKVKGAKTKDDAVLDFMMATKGLNKTSKCGKTLVAYNTRGKAYPFIYEDAGKKYKCTELTAKMYFGKK